jgi:hypothetical protein
MQAGDEERLRALREALLEARRSYSTEK